MPTSLKFYRNFLFAALFTTLSACSTTPLGRKQLILLNPSQVDKLGSQSFKEIQKEKQVSHDSKQNRMTRCVVDHLLVAMGEKPSQWDVLVFKDDTANAFALPGRHVGVHTGMFKVARNADQLAAVLGHEIGHVLAQHGNERMSQSMVAQLGLQVTQIALGNDSRQDQLIMGALGIGAQVGILLPFSRKQESEADALGIQYMAKAGFDPAQAPELWKIMAANEKGAPAEFLSTHPSSTKRARVLAQKAKALKAVYQKVQPKPNCD